ncbi:MAG: hypothetical protein IPJ69_05625 [Deltaproteobacteria bacterium]|nr:MAG: hypothetical protein IPJ69_05625 [Deltaproteobacteria bacterium]
MNHIASILECDDSFTEEDLKEIHDHSGTANAPRVRIPDANYEAQATGYKIVPYRGANKIYIQLRVTSTGEHIGKEIWTVYQEYKKYGPRSYFYKACAIALERVPFRGERLKPNSICGKIYLINTRTVKEDEDGFPHPEHCWYSLGKIIKLVQDTHNVSPLTGNPLPHTNYRLPTMPSLKQQIKRGFQK